MKKLFMAVIALMMTISASAQFYIYYSDGTVAKVDSISLVAPEEPEKPEPSQGIGVFSVSADKQVTFSKGNLQYHPKNDEWRFAEKQTDYIGRANKNIAVDYNGWIDLFGWGTSDDPTLSSSNNSDYYIFFDWGRNKVGNDAPHTWRTLTYYEWSYLCYKRTNADNLLGIAQVNGVNGLLFLPDNWVCPAGVTFKSGCHSNYGAESYAAYQTFTADQWSKLEKSGAVFLPAAGYRDGTYVYYVQYLGIYWSATESGSGTADCLFFSSDEADMDVDHRYDGLSVRLVKDL